jgi:hypothetical protein
MKTILTLIVLFASQIFPATYYVSTAGSDSYTALQARNMATPWQTLSKGAPSLPPRFYTVLKEFLDWHYASNIIRDIK